MGNKIPIEKSLLKQGFFFIVTDRLFASSHKTLQVYRYCYCDQATLPKYWKFKRELLHKIHGLKNKMPIAPLGSKEPRQYSEKEIEIKTEMRILDYLVDVLERLGKERAE